MMLACNTNNNNSSMTTTDHHQQRRVVKLPLFLVSTVRSPRSFDGDGAVGLGIVAAMMMSTNDDDANPAPSIIQPRSDPIAIHSPRPATATSTRGDDDDDDYDDEEEEEEEKDEELSESYTCIITHFAGNTVKKRVYDDDNWRRNYDGGGGLFFYQSPLPTADFLSRCCLCKKNLHGLDIFMYRSDKAFCSSECRCQQILSDEYRESCGSGALKTFEYSVSPLLFAVGVAAA